MPTAAPKKVSKRGRIGEGRPTKQTPEIVQKIANAIALGLADDEAASLAGISDLTLTKWRRDPEFIRQIKNAVSTRLALRLSKIESGADGWQGTAWLLERLYPTRFSKPEVQLNLIAQQNVTLNELTINITADELRQFEERAEPVRESVRELYARYRPSLGNGNGEKKVIDVAAQLAQKPVEKPAESLSVIVRKDGDEKHTAFWGQFCGDLERHVDKSTAIYVAAETTPW